MQCMLLSDSMPSVIRRHAVFCLLEGKADLKKGFRDSHHNWVQWSSNGSEWSQWLEVERGEGWWQFFIQDPGSYWGMVAWPCCPVSCVWHLCSIEECAKPRGPSPRLPLDRTHWQAPGQGFALMPALTHTVGWSFAPLGSWIGGVWLTSKRTAWGVPCFTSTLSFPAHPWVILHVQKACWMAWIKMNTRTVHWTGLLEGECYLDRNLDCLCSLTPMIMSTT